MYYRVIDTGSGYEVATLQSFDEDDYDSADYAVPVKFHDEEEANKVARMLNFGGSDLAFERGLVEGIELMRRDGVEYDPGNIG
jgi:hypothetical protein